MNRLPVVVLVAGASRRMGRPKALLPVGGSSCLKRVLAAFKEAGQGPVILVLGAHAERIREAVPPGSDVIEVFNQGWEGGQTGSLKAGLRAIPPGSPGVFMMPVDHPLLRAGDIRALARRLASAPEGKSLFVPTWRGRRGHPLLLAAEHLRPVLQMDDGEPLSGYLRARTAQVEHVAAQGPGVLRGMNTEKEYREIQAALEREGGAQRP